MATEQLIKHVASVRIGAALLQAAILYGLTSAASVPLAWPATEPAAFNPFFMLAILIPVAAQMGLGELPIRRLVGWLLCAVVVLGSVGFHAGARDENETLATTAAFVAWPPFWFSVSVVLAMFVAQSLAIASLREGRWFPAYEELFDLAWKQAIQLLLSILFVVAFWALLHLAASLFQTVELPFLSSILKERWFNIPATTLAFAASIDATNVRPQVLRAARSLSLTLVSWLTPLFVILLAAFLLTLPFVSLDRLWATGVGTTTLVAAAAWLIFLINASWQDGLEDSKRPPLKRASLRVACVVLAPVVSLAAWGLWMRVAQHGLSTRRVVVAAILIVGLCYAVGYLVAGVRDASRARILARTNLATAYVILAVIVALCSPIADPARLMVESQLARLASGQVAHDKIDINALKFDGAKWGRDTVARLAAGGDTVLASRARETMKRATRFEFSPPIAPFESRAAMFVVRPEGRALPTGFIEAVSAERFIAYTCLDPNRGQTCVARLVSMGSGSAESVLVALPGSTVLFDQNANGVWRRRAYLNEATCQNALRFLRDNDPTFEHHELPDVVLGGARFTVIPVEHGCLSR